MILSSGGSVAASALIVPRDFANNDMWYDGNDPAGDGSLITTNTSLTNWIDKSPSGFTVAQATGATKPVAQPNLYNGKAAVNCNGSQYMTRAYAAALNPATFTLMMVLAVTGGAGTYRAPIASRGTGANTRGFNIYASSANNLEFWVGNNGTVNWQSVTANAITLNNLYLITCYAPQAANPVVVNQTAYSGVTSAYTQNTSGQFVIGALTDLTSKFIGNLCEIIRFSRIISAWEWQMLCLYLSTKWGGGIS